MREQLIQLLSGLYQGRQLYKMLPPKLNIGPVADAFARVINVAAYQGKWITAKDYAHIINYEHDGYVKYNSRIIQLVKNSFITRICLCCFRAVDSSKEGAVNQRICHWIDVCHANCGCCCTERLLQICGKALFEHRGHCTQYSVLQVLARQDHRTGLDMLEQLTGRRRDATAAAFLQTHDIPTRNSCNGQILVNGHSSHVGANIMARGRCLGRMRPPDAAASTRSRSRTNGVGCVAGCA